MSVIVKQTIMVFSSHASYYRMFLFCWFEKNELSDMPSEQSSCIMKKYCYRCCNTFSKYC